jgi:hypothetical protein
MEHGERSVTRFRYQLSGRTSQPTPLPLQKAGKIRISECGLHATARKLHAEELRRLPLLLEPDSPPGKFSLTRPVRRRPSQETA